MSEGLPENVLQHPPQTVAWRLIRAFRRFFSLPGEEKVFWSFCRSEKAMILLDAGGRLIRANQAALALAGHAMPGHPPERLLELLPVSAVTTAVITGCWKGRCATDTALLDVVIHYADHRGAINGVAVFEDAAPRDVRSSSAPGQDELLVARQRLAGAQEQLLQSEKMASIGVLAAGVAHEINNPIGYVHSNLGTLQEYVGALFTVLESYETALQSNNPAGHYDAIRRARERMDIDFILGDLPKLMAESREGIERVTKIVRDLKDFSYAGRGEPMRPYDLHKGLESTLNIVWNDLKYKVKLEKNYGDLPLVECHLSEINQVLMSLLINAGQSIDNRGAISITTGAGEGEAWIDIADAGCGIPPEVLPHIFEPFFTTKSIGRGTGLGLAIAYGIIAKHHGRIEVVSEIGAGSRFRVVLPVVQPPGGPVSQGN